MPWRTILLACGIAAGILYIAMDIVAATFLYPGYDYTTQQVSELSAIGAPTRTFWLVMGYPFALLSLAFGAGVWLAARDRVSLKIAGALLGLFTVNGFLWGWLAPMHMRGTEFTDTDVMHIAFAASAVIMMVAFISFGAAALGRAFRIYSALTIVLMLAAGGVVSTQVSAIASDQPTPWIGLIERVSVYSPMIWLAAFGWLLIRRERENGMNRSAPAHPGV